jgi:hypothetical protein
MDAEPGWGTLKLPWKKCDQRFVAGLNDGIPESRNLLIKMSADSSGILRESLMEQANAW